MIELAFIFIGGIIAIAFTLSELAAKRVRILQALRGDQ